MRVDRIDRLEDYILLKKSATLDSLCDEFQVSKNTLRRDIDTLIKRGNISKVYGGVVAVEKKQAAPLRSFDERSSLHKDLKEKIAGKMAEHIEDGDTIFLDTGSSTLPLLKYLEGFNDVTIVTNSVPAIYEALLHPSLKVIALPGMLNCSTDSLVGAGCLEALQRFHLKKSIMSCTGLSIEHGVCNASFAEFEIKHAACALCEEAYLLADHTKFGVTSMMSYARIEQFDHIITDELPDAIMQGYLEEKKVHISI